MREAVAENERHKEQHRQMQSVMNSAADYVAQLESENRSLRHYISSALQTGHAGDLFPDLPPPDVC
jgi:hypothetical protein